MVVVVGWIYRSPLSLFSVLVARLEGIEQAESGAGGRGTEGWEKSAWLAFVLQMSMLLWPCGYSSPSRLTAYSGQRGHVYACVCLREIEGSSVTQDTQTT